MKSEQSKTEQVRLNQHQIEAFYINCFAELQAKHFVRLIENLPSDDKRLVVDMGGGCGYFAKALNELTQMRVRVVDSDERSVEACRNHKIDLIEANVGDALNPEVKGDEDIICFNLMLHHLVGTSERETRQLQKRAIEIWRDKSKYLFVNEYIYDSFLGYLSGRIIFEITKSKLLSKIGKFVSRVIPAFNANTFGIGVRFRAHDEWIELFEECGFDIVSKACSAPDYTALPLRALLIRVVRKDSFLLRRRRDSASDVRIR